MGYNLITKTLIFIDKWKGFTYMYLQSNVIFNLLHQFIKYIIICLPLADE